MARILALDYGQKRTGVAVTDPMQLIGSPLRVLPTHDILSFLSAYIAKENVETIVVGWPLELSGKVGSMAHQVAAFVRVLKQKFTQLSIELIDERFTSVLAKKSLLEMGMKKKDRRKKKDLDAISAALLLRSYLEQKEAQAKRLETKKNEVLF